MTFSTPYGKFRWLKLSFGHKLTPDGLKADESKIEAIVKMCPPKNETDLKSFLGMVNYLGQYTPALAEL